MGRPRKYTDKHMLDALREHCVEGLGSTYTVHNPCWNGYLKRMRSDAEFDDLVQNIVAEANYKWEQIGLKALLSNDTDFNVTLFKHYTQNKKSFLSREALEIEERMDAIEEKMNAKR